MKSVTNLSSSHDGPGWMLFSMFLWNFSRGQFWWCTNCFCFSCDGAGHYCIIRVFVWGIIRNCRLEQCMLRASSYCNVLLETFQQECSHPELDMGPFSGLDPIRNIRY